MITLPDGKRNVVFTKREIQIDSQGNVIKEAAQRKKSSGDISHVGKERGREGKKALQKKLLRQEAAAQGRSSQSYRFAVSQIHHEHIRLRSCYWKAEKMK